MIYTLTAYSTKGEEQNEVKFFNNYEIAKKFVKMYEKDKNFTHCEIKKTGENKKC
jgi:uncharacterized protein YxeA